VINNYIIKNRINIKTSEWLNEDNHFENEWFKPQRFAICDENGNTYTRIPRNDDPICIQVEGYIEKMNEHLAIGYYIYDENEVIVYHSASHDAKEQEIPKFQVGYNKIRTFIPKRFLNEATYRIELVVFIHSLRHICERAVNSPSIFLTIEGGLSDSKKWILKRPGIIAPLMRWESIT
jgi:lipopolysaccharide transport system ATP-binding protein